MIPKRNYYLNDYFDMFNMPLNKEYMKTDIYELDNKYYLEIDLPGIKKENIKINYENGYLTISAEKNVLSSGPNTYIRRERFYGEIKRSFYNYHCCGKNNELPEHPAQVRSRLW